PSSLVSPRTPSSILFPYTTLFRSKSTIIYAGDKSNSLYYIVKGSVTVLIEDDEGREMIVAYLNDGDFFGEMGFFDDKDPRSAWIDRKSTRLNSSHVKISYAVFCLK